MVSFEVSKQSLSTAATALALLPREINDAPKLDAESVAKALLSSAVGGALNGSDGASRIAKSVLAGRFNEFAGLLQLSADTYHDTDADAAARIAAVTDLNSGDPHAPAPQPHK